MKELSKKYNEKNFTLAFEAKGLKPLVQELIYKGYYHKETVMTFNNQELKVFISNNSWKKLSEEGEKNLSKNDFYTEIPGKMKQLLENLSTLIKQKEKNEQIIELFVEGGKLYGYFDIPYFESAYNSEDKLIKENLETVTKIKDEVKEDFSKLFFFEDSLLSKFLEELSNQRDISLEELEWYLLSDIQENKKLSTEQLTLRKKAYVFYDDKFICGDEAKEFINNFFEKQIDEENLSGTSANSKSNVIGNVKIINVDYDKFEITKQKIDEMEQGNILVSKTTDPSIMAACKKAAAIVTEVGGMLSHAAIISRELDIPCIVNVKNATTLLKDGDKIEVDSINASLRKIE